jgi:molecular chaperone DnaK
LKLEERRQAGDVKLVGSVPAYFLAGGVSVQEVVGQALGVDALSTSIQQHTLVPIVEQGTALPVCASKSFGLLNGEKGQTATSISVLQGEAYSPASAALILGDFPLSDLPAGPSEDRIEITFRVDTNGLVDVHAIDKHSGKEITQQVDAAGAVTKNDIS